MVNSEWHLNVHLSLYGQKIKDEVPNYYLNFLEAVIADENTDRFFNKEILILCLHYVRFCGNEKPYICEKILILYTFKTIEKSILLLLQRNGIDLSKCRVQGYDGASAMSTET